MRKLIVTADDLGISVGTNQAIQEGHRKGVLTSTSVLVTMPAFIDAVESVFPGNPALGVGLHLNLTSGPAALGKADIPLLVDEHGHFLHSFFGLYRMLLSRHRRQTLEQIRVELQA